MLIYVPFIHFKDLYSTSSATSQKCSWPQHDPKEQFYGLSTYKHALHTPLVTPIYHISHIYVLIAS